MKIKVILIIFISLALTSNGQNVGIGTSSPNALLDVYSTSDGILIPRVALTSTASASPLTSPAASTLVYNTATAGSGATAVSPGFYYWAGSAWVRFIDNNSLTGSTTVSNTSSANTLSTTVNGVTGSNVTIINTNTISQNGAGQLISTINGIGSTPYTATIAGDVTGSLGASTVAKIQGTPVTISSLADGNLLQYNAGGTSWVNVTPASVLGAATTNTLSLSTNTLTSTVNGVAATSSAVSAVSNTSSANTLSTTVNGVTGSTVPIINTNTLSQNGSGQLISTINGVGSTPYTETIAGDVTGNLGTSTVAKLQGQPVSSATPTAGQVLEYSNGIWTPTSPGASLFTAGTGLSWSGTTLNSTGVTSFSGGSTGLTPASATAGAISLAGTLGIGYGGTGATTAATALANLGGAPASGSGNYIQNGTSPQTANFNITGTGTAATSFTTSGYFYNSSTGIGQIVMNSSGTYYGNISNPASQVWALGYTSAPTALGTPVLSWTPSGYVGIGTTSPGYALEVTNPALYESRVYIHPTTANGTDYALLQLSNSGGTSYFGMDNSAGTGLGSGTGYALTTYAASGIPISYITGGSERMRILNSGNVAIGTTVSNNKLTVLDPTETDRVVAIKRGTQGSDVSLPTGYGSPYLSIGGLEYATGAVETIGFGYSDGTSSYIPPAEIGFVMTTIAGYTSGDLVFAIRNGVTNAAPGELMRIKANGNVGIGTNNPVTNLDVSGTTTPGITVASTNYPTNYNTQLGTQAGAQGILVLGNNGTNEIRFGNTGTGGLGNIYVNNTASYTSAATGTLAMTFAANGMVGVGSPSPVYQMQVNGRLNAGYVVLGDKNNNVNNTIEFVNGTGSQTYAGGGHINYYGSGYLSLGIGGGYVGVGLAGPSYRLTLPNTAGAGGEVVANSYAAYSDERIKSDRQPLKYGLQTVMQLKPLQYFQHNSTTDSNGIHIKEEGGTSFGLLAQETYKLVPEMVNRPKDESKDLWTMDYSKLGPILVKAIQEQQQLIEAQSREIEQLKQAIKGKGNR